MFERTILGVPEEELFLAVNEVLCKVWCAGSEACAFVLDNYILHLVSVEDEGYSVLITDKEFNILSHYQGFNGYSYGEDECFYTEIPMTIVECGFFSRLLTENVLDVIIADAIMQTLKLLDADNVFDTIKEKNPWYFEKEEKPVLQKRKVLIQGVHNRVLILTDAPADAIREWCTHHNQEKKQGKDSGFDSLSAYFLRILLDSKEDSSDSFGAISWDERYDLSYYDEDYAQIKFGYEDNQVRSWRVVEVSKPKNMSV